jgi:dTDP-4-dehydrorhamnose 3,5-epimerase
MIGEATYVTCAVGAILDVVVDLRVGSPTFGTWEPVLLDDLERRALVLYLCSTPYAPGREHGIDPLDPKLGIAWPLGDLPDRPVLSAEDAEAPSLAEALEAGALQEYEICRSCHDRLASDLPSA